MKPRMSRSKAGALALVAVSAFVVAARPFAPGYSYTFTSTTTTNGSTSTVAGRGVTAGSMAKLTIDDAKGRQAQGGPVSMDKGSTMYFDGANTIIAFANAKNECSKMNLASVGQFMGGAMQMVGAMVKMEVSDVNASNETVGNETVSGQSTKHVRSTITYTLSASAFGQKSISKVKSVSDYWISAELKDLLNPYVEMGQGFTNAMGNMGGMKQVFDKMESERKALMTGGYPVKMRQVQETVDDKGKTQTSTQEWEMKDIKPANETIAIPSNCQDMGQAMGNAIRAASDSANAGSSASAPTMPSVNKDSVIKAAQDSAASKAKQDAAKKAAEEAKNKLKGIFRRP